MAEWSASYINDLPDSSFLYIESGGEKDDEGKTTPRSLRHFPVKDADGTPDPAHLRNALARIPQSNLPQSVKDGATAECRRMLDATKSADEELARAVKFVAPDTIEGLAMPFGPDTDGEAFTPDTDLCLDWFGKSGRPVLYNHGLDPAHRATKVGRQTEYEVRDEGIWAQSQLDANARYRKAIDRLIEDGALGYSSGAYAHLATKNRKGEITRWPWVELSLTPFPAHPAALGVHYIKSADLIELLDEDVPEPLKAALSALDEWAASRDDDSSPAGLKFDAHADRLLVDMREFLDRASEVASLRAKSGRVLSAATRDRLAKHPELIRQVADDLDELLATADAGKSATADLLIYAAGTALLDERLRDLNIRGIPA